MTEREIIEKQEQTGNREYYLMLVGSFLHAYGNGAFALARATGYRVMRKKRKSGEVLTVGFPVSRLGQVRQRLVEHGGEMEQVDDRTWTFRGVDGNPDEQIVCEPLSSKASLTPKGIGRCVEAEVVAAIRSFNLSMSTPMDAMLFLGTLQQRLNNNNDACESPAG